MLQDITGSTAGVLIRQVAGHAHVVVDGRVDVTRSHWTLPDCLRVPLARADDLAVPEVANRRPPILVPV